MWCYWFKEKHATLPHDSARTRGFRSRIKTAKTIDRPRITAAIADAREHGDLKENAEYHAAREQQGFCDTSYP